MKNLKKLTEKLNILYVEDEEASRRQLSEIFNLLFNTVDTAFDGEDAFEKYQIKPYDIIITDINMPRMNGLELIEKIKAQNPSQNIIIISAHNNSEYLLQAIEIGVDSFIIKPLKNEQLTLVLTKVANGIYAQKISLRYNEQLEAEIEEKTAKLAQQFVTDELTGLLNRNALIKKYNNDNEEKIMLLLSIDNFDSINITYGYDNGDIILKELANFLKEKVPQETKLYRVNSNEFALVSAKKD
jgi:PleD family two-component response regulator